jgi:PAS domain S-box-containing protein
MSAPTASSPLSDPSSPAASAATLLNALLAATPDHLYFKDRNSRFLHTSLSQARAFGCQAAAELIGKSDFDFFDEQHARTAFEDEQRIIATGEPMLGRLEKETWHDGHVTWVLTHKLPLRNDAGEIIGTFGVSKDVTAAKETELALERAQRELVDASRTAGMAEVATGVLHNVGNVLNSLNVSVSVIISGLKQSRLENLGKVVSLLREHGDDLGGFLTKDPKGRIIPEFLASLAQHAIAERERLLREAESFQKNLDHIKEIVAMQQSYATMVGITEPLEPAAMMEDALRMNSVALARHAVRVVRAFQPVPCVVGEKGKVLQILVNLIRNAKYATDEGGRADKVITLRVEAAPERRVRFVVEDNGVGISAENLTHIFTHGFTTRARGHGFGLHSSLMAAQDMKGTLVGASDGPGQGARFTLELPIAEEPPTGSAMPPR